MNDPLVKLIEEGKASEATEQIKSSLENKIRDRIEEERKRLGGSVYEETEHIPNTKGSIQKLHDALISQQYEKTKEGPGARHSHGKITLHYYDGPNATHIRVHHLVKSDGGEHVGWGHMKASSLSKALHVVKQGTGHKSLLTYLQKLHNK